MTQIVPKVLVVDDEANILKTMGVCFNAVGYETHLYSKPQEALDALHREKFGANRKDGARPIRALASIGLMALRAAATLSFSSGLTTKNSAVHGRAWTDRSVQRNPQQEWGELGQSPSFETCIRNARPDTPTRSA